MSLLVVGFEALTSFTLCLGQERSKAASMPVTIAFESLMLSWWPQQRIAIGTSQIRLSTWLTRPHQLFGCSKTQNRRNPWVRSRDHNVTKGTWVASKRDEIWKRREKRSRISSERRKSWSVLDSDSNSSKPSGKVILQGLESWDLPWFPA